MNTVAPLEPWLMNWVAGASQNHVFLQKGKNNTLRQLNAFDYLQDVTYIFSH